MAFLGAEHKDVVQAAYQLEVGDEDQDVVCDNGRILSDEPFGAPLRRATSQHHGRVVSLVNGASLLACRDDDWITRHVASARRRAKDLTK